MLSAARRMSQRAGVTAPRMRTARPGPGNGWRVDNFLGQTEFQPELAHLVLEKALQRLDQFELHLFGQAADVVMAFDQRRRIAGNRHRFNDVGIQRALGEKFRCAGALGRRLENFDERFADDFSFALGIGHALEPAQE